MASRARRATVGAAAPTSAVALLPEAAQLAALDELAGLLRRPYGIRLARIYGHRDLGASACPGRLLYPHVRELRTAV